MPAPPLARLDSTLPDGWSLAPSRATHLLRCDADGRAKLSGDGGVLAEWSDPLDALARLAAPPPDGPPGRWVGYFGYDLGRRFEPTAHAPPLIAAVDDLRLPLFAFGFHPDNGTGIEAQERSVHAGAKRSAAPGRVRSQRRVFTPHATRGGTALGPGVGARSLATRSLLDAPAAEAAADRALTSTLPRPAYLAACRRVIDYIAAGDIFQANLTHRLTVGLTAPPEAIYDRLLARAPAAYAALLDFGDFALVCNSPELFLRVTPQPDGTRRVVTRPIKGTRPNAPGLTDAMAAELLASEKDAAELNMIVDLERNDLGRVCRPGTVRVTRPRTVEAHPTVVHGVSTVEGTLRPDVALPDLLAATFPGGSITGAPKVRAMQVIDELEPTRRGPYCGAIGWVGTDGSLELNVAIRTIVCKGGRAHLGVGGGIVADSDSDAEYAETWTKAAAMLDALGVG